jgi:[ribosomal protein S18]-alanine N-acetyltransferase
MSLIPNAESAAAYALATVGPSHAPIVAALHADAFATPTLSGPAWSTEAFVAFLMMPGCLCRLLLRKGTPIGFALWRIVGDEAELLTLAVAHAQRRQGAGAMLLRDGLHHMCEAGATAIFLEVAIINLPARKLYDSFLFQQVGLRPGYYQWDKNKVDAYIMRRLIE